MTEATEHASMFAVFRSWLSGPRGLRNGSLLLFGALSFFSTFMGFHDLARSQFGALPTATVAFMAVFVLASTLMMIYFLGLALTPAFGSRGLPRWMCWVVWAMFAFFSIGFAFGFYWKFFAARNETNAAVETVLAQVDGDLNRAAGDLDLVAGTFARARDAAQAQAETERTVGRTCSDNSGPGFGPRRQFREQTAARAAAFYSEVIDQVGGPPTPSAPAAPPAAAPAQGAQPQAQGPGNLPASPRPGSVRALLQDSTRLLSEYRQKADSSSTEERARLVNQINSKNTEIMSRYASISTSLKANEARYRLEARNAADPGLSIPLAPGTVCLDATYATQMDAAADAIDRLDATLTIPRIPFEEGERGTLEAFKRLGEQLGADRLLARLSQEQRSIPVMTAPSMTVQASGETANDRDAPRGLREGDWLPLGIAIMVDLIILALSLDRRRTGYDSLTGILEKMLAAIGEPERRALLRLIQRHRIVTAVGDEYLVVPQNLDDDSGFALANAAPIWERRGLVRRAALLPTWPGSQAEAVKVQRLLDRTGSGITVTRGKFRLYRLAHKGLIETGMLGQMLSA